MGNTMGTDLLDCESEYMLEFNLQTCVFLTLYRLVDGIKDNVQVYNIPKFDGHHLRQQPKVLQDNIEEIERFSRVCSMGHIFLFVKF